jgi:uncharacterized protein (TIGR02300 family)
VEKKAELGTKRICPSCAARFYDLGKRPITCPKCQTSFEPEALLRPRRQRPEPREAPAAKPVEVAEEEEEAEEVFESEEEEVLEDEPLEEVVDEPEDEAAPGKPAGPAAKRRKRPPVVVEDDIELPDTGDDDVAADGEDEDVLVEDEDLDDAALSEIDPDLEDDGPKTAE